MKTARQALSAAVLTLLGLATPAAAGDTTYTYTYVDLGTLGGPGSAAFGLNDARQVVGWAHISGCSVDGAPCYRAFLWDDGSMTDLGLLAGDEGSFARAINNNGIIVGTSERDVVAASGVYHGFSHDGVTMTPLPTLGLDQSFAHDINDAGQIAGHTQDPSVVRDRAVIWESGGITNVGDTDGHSYNRGYGISEAGVLVGFAWNLFEPNDSILYAGGSWLTIGGTDGPFQNSEASDVNDSGVAVGLQAFPSGNWHAAVWTQVPPGTIDAGVLPGFNYGELYDVNEAGLAVGRSYMGTAPDVSHAVLWDGSQLLDLADLVADEGNAVLWEAREINENGDIAGTAVVGNDFRAFLLVASEASPWTDLGLGLAGTHGVPGLLGTGTLEANDPISIQLGAARENATANLVVGWNRLDLPFYCGTLVPAFASPDGLFVTLFTNGAGEISINDTWPSGVPSGFTIYMQYWIDDPAAPCGLSASNAISGTAP